MSEGSVGTAPASPGMPGGRTPEPVLEIEDLSIAFATESGSREAVRHVSLAIQPREIYGLVGESGSGKTTLALGAIRYLAENGRVTGGRVTLAGRDLFSLGSEEMRRVWGGEVAMVYQNPATALNPSLTIGRQLQEVGRTHLGLSKEEARERGLQVLRQVAMPEPQVVVGRYPHQLSGGMLQRCVIAMALIPRPQLLIMDEPTTSLDVTTQAVVLDLVSDLRRELDSAILYITHDLGVVARMCDRVGVMHAGELVEEAEVGILFRSPQNPYTLELLSCVPRFRLDEIAGPAPAEEPTRGGAAPAEEWATLPAQPPAHPPAGPLAPPEAIPLLEAVHISKRFAVGGAGPFRRRAGAVVAVDDVTLELRRGRTLGVVGESGSGKTTTARCITGLEEPSSGEVRLEGRRLAAQLRRRPRSTLRRLQMVFQNPDSSLNPRQTVREIVGRPAALLRELRGAELEREVERLLESVRLPADYAGRVPAELSGGEKQRVAIARAFAALPEIVVCDEPISSLDVCVQRALRDLLRDLQLERETSYLFISHDLAAVQQLSDEIAVMYRGHIVEWGEAALVLRRPYHPYTEALLSAVPVADPGVEQERIRLAPASAAAGAAGEEERGCPFWGRCHRGLGQVCAQEAPPLQVGSGNHYISCHIPLAELARLQNPALRAGGGD